MTYKLDPDRFFPIQARARQFAHLLYNQIKNAPIISPHGHTDPAWFANNTLFANPTDLLLVPDHYVLRMLYSQGIRLEELSVSLNPHSSPHAAANESAKTDPRAAWKLFAENYFLFRGTPSRIWMDHVFFEVFDMDVPLSGDTADTYYDTITEALKTPSFSPRAILDEFNIQFLATTEGALDPLTYHDKLIEDGWGSRIVTTFRPDDVLDASRSDFQESIEALGAITGEDTTQWHGYLKALRARRIAFKDRGATATDHGHPTAQSANLRSGEAASLFEKCLSGKASKSDQELFRAQMLTEMAVMSLDDGLVMQLHPGSYRNHNSALFDKFGPDKGADIPTSIEYVHALKPLLDRVGNEPDFTLILFTLDETNYARELAPLAGHYPCLKLGPPWWFHDSPEGMMRYRRQVTETAGFYNTTGFNDDTRALLSIPARHDLARRMDCRFLAELVTEGRLREDEAFDLIHDLTTNLVIRAYNLKAIDQTSKTGNSS